MSYNSSANVPLQIKYIFLSFAQAFFAENTKFTWERDVTTTKIYIADRYVTDLGVGIHRPTIVLTRGDLGWAYLVRGQDGTNSSNFISGGFQPVPGIAPNVDTHNRKIFTDILKGSIIFNVISKNGVQADEIANLLFVGLTGYQDDFKAAGIKFRSLTIGAARPVKIDAEVQLESVPIQIYFETQRSVRRDEHYNNVNVYVNGEEVFESLDYKIITNGVQVSFLRTLPENAVITASYTDAITLSTVSDVTLVATADPLVFTIPDAGSILGYYELSEEMKITLTTHEDADDYQQIDDQVITIDGT